MAAIVSIMVNLDKIPTEEIRTSKAGNRYVNLDLMINDKTGRYGDNASISVRQTRDQRDAREPKIFVGNGKVVWTNGVVQIAERQQSRGPQPPRQQNYPPRQQQAQQPRREDPAPPWSGKMEDTPF